MMVFYIKTHDKIFIVVGAGPTKYDGWFSTDIHTLDLTKEPGFRRYFGKKKINKILAEHVMEHLSEAQIDAMLNNIKKYSDSDINIRIAVPDGYHQDKEYIDLVKPGGTGYGADDHKNLFNYISLSAIFEKHGFSAKPVEYWDENGEFHPGYNSDDNGYIKRCLINDKRNSDGNPHYTSLIIDFVKEKSD
jgi:predicted SAM-dependent methyltransferase